jgi:hypothetical protein
LHLLREARDANTAREKAEGATAVAVAAAKKEMQTQIDALETDIRSEQTRRGVAETKVTTLKSLLDKRKRTPLGDISGTPRTREIKHKRQVSRLHVHVGDRDKETSHLNEKLGVQQNELTELQGEGRGARMGTVKAEQQQQRRTWPRVVPLFNGSCRHDIQRRDIARRIMEESKIDPANFSIAAAGFYEFWTMTAPTVSWIPGADYGTDCILHCGAFDDAVTRLE